MKRRMKRVMAMALALAMTASAVLTGCGGSKKKAEDGEKVLTVWAWDVALMQLQEAAEVYQKDHPDVKFEFEEMGTDQIYKKLSTSLATGNGIADIIAIEGDVLVGYADKFPEGFLDVSDAVNADEFLASKLAEVTYKDKVHAFPWDAGPVGMFYRTDYFEQAGVNPEDIQTWDDLIEAGKKIEAACKTPSGDPVKMIPVDPKKSSLYSLIRGEFGIGVFDEDGNPIVDDERSISAMKMADKIYDSGVALNYNGWDEYEQTVVNESVACIPEAVWMIGTIKDKGPQTEGKWSVMDIPKIEGGEYSCSNGGSDLAINAKTDYPEEAKDFVKFAMTDTTLQASGFEKYGLYPSYIPSYEEEVFQKGDAFFGEGNVYEIFIENGQKVADTPISPNAQEASDTIGVAVSKILLNGEDVEKTMKDLQKELETKFQ
ncbi:ABC transporter substrate-binding protein [Bariatricus sp. HCP28S3_C2]|uniref:ABC transporter substrate-binding protein n=1 Tax=unclassified Bariatricus TaxID=2677046 RepID=UPI003F8B5F5E